MRIEVDPALPENIAEALGANGKLIVRFKPVVENAAGTAALRVSAAAFDRIWTALEKAKTAPR